MCKGPETHLRERRSVWQKQSERGRERVVEGEFRKQGKGRSCEEGNLGFIPCVKANHWMAYSIKVT